MSLTINILRLYSSPRGTHRKDNSTCSRRRTATPCAFPGPTTWWFNLGWKRDLIFTLSRSVASSNGSLSMKSLLSHITRLSSRQNGILWSCCTQVARPVFPSLSLPAWACSPSETRSTICPYGKVLSSYSGSGLKGPRDNGFLVSKADFKLV